MGTRFYLFVCTHLLLHFTPKWFDNRNKASLKCNIDFLEITENCDCFGKNMNFRLKCILCVKQLKYDKLQTKIRRKYFHENRFSSPFSTMRCSESKVIKCYAFIANISRYEKDPRRKCSEHV